jgi:hypothetical protein
MRKSWITIGVTVFLVISALAVLSECQFLAEVDQNTSQSWMFKGAYATYEGKINSLSTPYNLTAEIQVIDLNVSHIQIRTNSTIAKFSPQLFRTKLFYG